MPILGQVHRISFELSGCKTFPAGQLAFPVSGACLFFPTTVYIAMFPLTPWNATFLHNLL